MPVGRGAVANLDASTSQPVLAGRALALVAMCLFGVGIGLGSCAAHAATIDNIASVSYRLENQGEPTSLWSNTVRIHVLPLPTEADLEFRRYDPDAEGGTVFPIDGGQCMTPADTFIPLPLVHELDGTPLDPSSANTDPAPGFYTGEPVVIVVRDVNRNVDPLVREFVEVDITTTTGDTETVRLQETGVDTAVFAGAIQSVPMPPHPVANDCLLSLEGLAEITARYTDRDFPLDALAVVATSYTPPPPGKTVIRLEHAVSRQIVEVGDFLQYTFVLGNSHDAPAFGTSIIDTLPPGLRYRAGSARVGDARIADGAIVASNGRTVTIPTGNLAPGASVTAAFVAEVGPAARGPELVNTAIAKAGGGLSSNQVDSVTRLHESMLTDRITIIGRILEGECGEPGAAVPGVRLLLEDGTFVMTDENGAYHFAGVRAGTHVVQLDLATLPPDLEAVPCGLDTRMAGRGYSRFVEAQGGTMWRADFRLVRKAMPEVVSEAGMRTRLDEEQGALRFTIDLDGNADAVTRLRAMAVFPDGSRFARGSATLDGEAIADPQLLEGTAVFDLGDPGRSWRKTLAFRLERGPCPEGGYVAKAMMLIDSIDAPGQRTPPVTVVRPCGGPPGEGVRDDRIVLPVAAAPQGPAASPSLESINSRDVPVSDSVAAGAQTDWLVNQAPGRELLFPTVGHNPRAPVIRIAVKYRPGDKATLRINGKPVSPLNYEGTTTSADRTVAVGLWTGVPIGSGDNLLQAEITDGSGALVETLERNVHYATGVVRAELVAEKSALVADGIQRPVVAVRMLDASGYPASKGAAGEFEINPPYGAWREPGLEQGRAFAGVGESAPTWHVAGDDGIAYIELAPTGNAGALELGFRFGGSGVDAKRQQVNAWLKAGAREWVVVGFAAGSVGYDTLRDNMHALEPAETGGGMRGEGQVALYAKGKVLGKWLLTVAYDSDKDTATRNRSLLSTIDPGQYYTLYGDGTLQGHDAASARKLYLKLERDQFYALFGDMQTGLDRGELSRYQRSMTGVKVEYRGALVEFNGFAARTALNFAREELQGDGTSGLYRLRHGDIVLNSEQVRIETRDRYHSEQILGTRNLLRHIDYDIDYDNGTLFFREPVQSRDFDFNPNWIVVHYETAGTTEEFLNAGGRAGVHMLDDRLEAGLTYVRDENAQGLGELAGLDARLQLGERDRIRAEIAATQGETADGDVSGNAWLLEWEHHGSKIDSLAYARRMEGAFGLGQQNGSEVGMFKAGVQGRYAIDQHWSLQGEAYHLEDMASGTTRDVVGADLAYRGDGWGAKAGLRWARDESADGRVAESRQLTVGASRSFLEQKLQVGVQADFGLGGGEQSVDYPTRLMLNASYAVNERFQVIGTQEFTHGTTRDTSTSRLGFNVKPWANADFTTTLNQTHAGENGARTFALFGLNQKFQAGPRWSFDLSVDSSRAFNQSGGAAIVPDPAQPIEAGGIDLGNGMNGDFIAVSGGASYRADLWMWNARLEGRQSDENDRYGFTTVFLRQARDGVAMSASLQAFSQRNVDGGNAILANAQLAWAFRPPGSRWSMLDKLEFRLDKVSGGAGAAILGQNTLAIEGSGSSRRLVNNFVLNYAADAWEGSGSVFDFQQRSQFSVYYGSKYVLDSLGGDDYAGYSDILGAEWRFDLSPRIDIGLRTSVLHSWSQKTFAWAVGPSLGFTPFTNAWVSLGYNVRGFQDRDFADAHHTAQGPYLVFRMKFDQQSLGLAGSGLK